MRKLILPACCFLLLSVSCNRKGDYTTDPNTVSGVPLKLLLPAAELAVTTVHSTELAWYASVFMQQQAGVARQWAGADRYQVAEADLNRPWNTAYATCLANLKIIADQAVTEHATAYAGIAHVLTAMTLGQLTDAWGDIPYAEALQQSGNLHPAYDRQEQVYAAIQQLLSVAVSELGDSSSLLPAGDDLLYNGDLSFWVKTAHVLQARYANHLSRLHPAESAAQALAAIDAGIYAGPEEDAALAFGVNQTDANPWFQFVNQRGDVRMGKFIVDLMLSTNDPRLPRYAAKDGNGNYSGSPAGTPDLTASVMGDLPAATDSKVPLVTFAEAKFIEAEAALRSGDNSRAATAFNTGVRASLHSAGIGVHPYLDSNAQESASAISLQKIMTQKYLALFSQTEVWADWRRTGFPSLQPAAETLTGTRYREGCLIRWMSGPTTAPRCPQESRLPAGSGGISSTGFLRAANILLLQPCSLIALFAL